MPPSRPADSPSAARRTSVSTRFLTHASALTLALTLALTVTLPGRLKAALGTAPEDGPARPPTPGHRWKLGNAGATLDRLDMLPLVENTFSMRYRYDRADNPKLAELRRRHRLDDVIAPGHDEFERQLLLLEWVHRQFKRFGQPTLPAHGALEILDAVANGHSFFCSQYVEVLVSAAASLGWVDRPLALRRHRGTARVGGSTEHSVTEIWSNQHGKWVMLDPTSNLHIEKNGVPLNAVEIRTEWFQSAGEGLTFVVGAGRHAYRKSDLPIHLGRFEGFGDLTYEPDEPDKYGFIGFIPNTDLMDSGYDYAGMFIVRDALCDGTTWHVRTVPEDPRRDPYFPLGQAHLDFQVRDGVLVAALRTLTPNFDHFEVRTGAGPWTRTGAHHPWPLREGPNRLEARTLNRFGVAGPVSVAEVTLHPVGKPPAPGSPSGSAIIPPQDRAWLEDATATLLRGCRVRADDGTWLYTPDGKGNYRALWTRDFAYMVENAGHLLPDDDVEAALRTLLRGIRKDGATPDRVQPDGVAIYVGGPPDRPLGEPNLDNGPFLVLAADSHLARLPKDRAEARFKEWAPDLRRALDWVPRGPSGLVWNDPGKPHSPYGFTDTIGKTGDLLFESLLYWDACQRIARRFRGAGDPRAADEFASRAQRIPEALDSLWDDAEGLFLAASRDCRQRDVWGNAFAVWLELPLGDRRDRILRWLVDHRSSYLWRGQVRHLPIGDHWQRLLAPVEPGRYQNGAFWATASGWVLHALALREPGLARVAWAELLDDFRAGGICECVSEGVRQLPSYVVSAANPLAFARRLEDAHPLPR